MEKAKIKHSEIDVIGFHGQTIFHSAADKISKQIGSGELLNKLTGLNVVYNFRENDIKNGGQGAPLTPIYHELIQRKLKTNLPVVFLNIGGIANITYINKMILYSIYQMLLSLSQLLFGLYAPCVHTDQSMVRL